MKTRLLLPVVGFAVGALLGVVTPRVQADLIVQGISVSASATGSHLHPQGWPEMTPGYPLNLAEVGEFAFSFTYREKVVGIADFDLTGLSGGPAFLTFDVGQAGGWFDSLPGDVCKAFWDAGDPAGCNSYPFFGTIAIDEAAGIDLVCLEELAPCDEHLWIFWGGGSIAGALGTWLIVGSRAEPPGEVVSLEITGASFNSISPVAISADGRTIAYVPYSVNATAPLHVRELGDTRPAPGRPEIHHREPVLVAHLVGEVLVRDLHDLAVTDVHADVTPAVEEDQIADPDFIGRRRNFFAVNEDMAVSDCLPGD